MALRNDPAVLAAGRPGRLVLSATSNQEAQRYANETLGSLPTSEDGRAVLLRTLAVFFQSSRSIRQCAKALGVHENTIRYRLGRIRELTGRDVASNADDRWRVKWPCWRCACRASS
jgi:DNA-binding PucR family transcriptional regulator